MPHAVLWDADLTGVNLTDANLLGANLSRAVLDAVQLSNDTILPNGMRGMVIANRSPIIQRILLRGNLECGVHRYHKNGGTGFAYFWSPDDGLIYAPPR